MEKEKNKNEERSPGAILKRNRIVFFMLFAGALVYIVFFGVPEIFWSSGKVEGNLNTDAKKEIVAAAIPQTWIAPDTATIIKDQKGQQIRYGRQLIASTASYFGPAGSIQHSGNGMNCQNCHLDAGTRPFGNNYSAVASAYPKFRERSGKVESIYKRINDCFERSLNGIALDSAGKEMQAIKAYIQWLGTGVRKGEKPNGAGLTELVYLDRAADPEKGKILYAEKCMSCHSPNGQGKRNANNITFQYPPLWGDHSYTTGAGLYRLSRFAGYIRSNMPFGADYRNPRISDEEAWDIAAYVNSQPRPGKDLSHDWPSVATKPVDYPFGPYSDTFSEKQHKYGPFAPITEANRKRTDKKKI